MNFCKISKEWTFNVDEGFRKKVALKYKWNQFQDLNCKGRKGHAKLDNTDLNEEAELWRVQRTENLCQETQFKKKKTKKTLCLEVVGQNFRKSKRFPTQYQEPRLFTL